jgi:membrane-bound serine protease (ClpP class)
LCFALFFWSRFLGGTADWLEVVLFVLGLACLAMEIFVIPGFGVFGISGILLILSSLVMAGHSWTFDLTTNLEGLAIQTVWVLLALTMVGVIGFSTARYLPQLPMFEAIILGPPGSSSEAEPQLRMNARLDSMPTNDETAIGERGVCMTMLRPAGKARLNNRILDVVSDGPFIAADATVEVVEVRGNRVVVREV